MKVKTKKYIALFETSEDTTTIGVSFPDVPGCVSAGKSHEEAYRMGVEALSFHLDMMKEDGEEIPEPRTLEQIKETWEDWGEWEREYDFYVVSIPYYPSEVKYKTLTITMPENLVARIDETGRTRSGFITDAVGAYL